MSVRSRVGEVTHFVTNGCGIEGLAHFVTYGCGIEGVALFVK